MSARRALLALSLAVSMTASAQTLTLKVGQSLQLALKATITRVELGDSAVAEVCLGEGGVMHVTGERDGATTLIVFTSEGRTEYEVRVQAEPGHETAVTGPWWPAPRVFEVPSVAAARTPTPTVTAPAPRAPPR